jgi:HSP20 family protein
MKAKKSDTTKQAKKDSLIKRERWPTFYDVARAGYIDPFRLMTDFDRAFENFRRNMMLPVRRFMPPLMRFQENIGEPSINIQDKGNECLLTAALPGIPKDGLEVHISNNEIEIEAKASADKEEKERGYIYKEHGYQSFYRRMPLPPGIIADKAEARMSDGILEVTLPKKEPTHKKKLHIK